MKKRKTNEISSLNEQLLSFDPGDVDLEELECRLEMLVLRDTPCCLCKTFSCPTFTGCGGGGGYTTYGSAFS